MASPREPERGLFLVGVLAAGAGELALAGEALARAFGPPALGSRRWRFDNTDYYREELGPEPLRAFLVFPELIVSGTLADRKLATNALETELAAAAGSRTRPVNLDPGYLTLAKLVLASAKNYSHRIHVKDGIYAEVTLQYRHGGWRTLPWTFPDFASGRYNAFFTEVRGLLAK